MDLQTLRADTRFNVFGDSTNTAYGNTDLDRNLNKAYLKYAALAMQYSGKWKIKGTYAYIDLQAGVYKYDISNEILKFTRVEAKLTASGKYQPIKQMDITDVTDSLETYEPVKPEYDLRDGFITIYTDIDIETVTNGLKLYVEKNLTELIGTTDEPELAEPFLDLMTADAGIPYCQGNEMFTKARELERYIDKRLPAFLAHYAHRSGEAAVLSPANLNLY